MDEGRPTKRLRLLFASSIPRWGGGERWLLDAAAGLQARGHDVLIAARPRAQLLDRARAAGVPARAVHMGGDLDPLALVHMRLALWAQRPHAVFVNLDKELRAVCLATTLGRRPLVFARKGSDDPLGNSLVRRLTYRRLTRLLTNSSTLARTRFADHPAVRPDLVRVLANGVPLVDDVAPSGRTAMRRELRLPRQGFLVLHVGELEARKGQETTLRALAELRARRAAARDSTPLPLVGFVGTGPDEHRLHVLSHELGVKEQVLWIGFRRDVERYLDAADLLVLPSRREGVPWTLLEAMAHRLPVVAARVSGIPEIVQDGSTGLLVGPDDPAGLADALDRLQRDPALQARLAAAGHASVRARWDAADMLHDLECLVYAHLIARRRPRRRGALFVDRDGTLIHDPGYNADPARVRLEPKLGRALRWVHDARLPVVVVSNQSGVARGWFGAAQVEAVNDRVRDLLEAAGAPIAGFYWCPHHPDHGPACDCRKPEPGLLRRAAAELNLDLEASFMVGDAPRDLEAGRRVGASVFAYAGPQAVASDHAAGPADLPRAEVPPPGAAPAAAGLPEAGLQTVAGPDPEAGFPAGTRLYRDWMALVRDLLRQAWERG